MGEGPNFRWGRGSGISRNWRQALSSIKDELLLIFRTRGTIKESEIIKFSSLKGHCKGSVEMAIHRQKQSRQLVQSADER